MADADAPVAEQPVTPGKQTTEYARTKSASVWGNVGMILGGIIAVAPEILERTSNGNPSSKAYILGGAILSVASVAYKTLVDLGYISARAEIKSAAITKARDGGANE